MLETIAIALAISLAMVSVDVQNAVAAQGAPRLGLEGTSVLSEAHVREAMGWIPETVTSYWADKALKRVLSFYKRQGYTHARGWVLENNKPGQPRFTLFIDEGRMDFVTVVGSNAFRSILLRVDLHLPNKTFHQATLDEAMARMIEKYDLRNAYYRIEDVPRFVTLPNGSIVEGRALRIYVISREAIGWNAGVSTNSTWGILPWVAVASENNLFKRDRLELRLGISVPVRQYFFDEKPKFHWVHGYLNAEYRFPGVGQFRLPGLSTYRFAPYLDTTSSYSRYERTEIGIARYYLWHTDAFASVSSRISRAISFSTGAGFDYLDVSSLAFTPENTKTYTSPHMTALAVRLLCDIEYDRHVLRHDLRSYVQVGSRLSFASEDQWVLRLHYQAQHVWNHEIHTLLVRSRSTLFAGKVNYWNEEPLSRYLRVFFSNRYWIDKVAELDVAYRIDLLRDIIALGVFHDVALFSDQTRANRPIAAANAFGPSLHFLILDTIAIDLYYGFGFAPIGLGHNLAFYVKTIF